MKPSLHSLVLLSVPFCALVSARAQGLLSQYGEIVMAVGDPVAALPGAVISADPFDNFDNPAIDRDGTVVFRAHFVGGGAVQTDDRAYFLGRTNGDLQMVVRAGDQAPGCPVGTLLRNGSSSQGLSNQVRISPHGGLLFFASNLYDPLNPSSTPAFADSALFWGLPSGLVLLAREGDPVPFLGTGEMFGQLSLSASNGVINGSGTVLFAASLIGGAASAADDGLLVTGQPGLLAAVLREGEVLATGEVVVAVSGGTNLSAINYLNEAGQVLHEIAFATTPPSTATAANNRGLAIWSPATGRVVIAREGQQAPGLPTGVLFGTPTGSWSPTPVANSNFTNSGQTLLNSPLVGGGVVPGVDDEALYLGGLAGWSLVLRKGDLCPGLSGGERFGTVGNNSMSCSDGGGLAFLSTLTGPGVIAGNDSATWIGTVGNLRLLAREGDLVPGLPPGPGGPWRFGNMTAGPETPNLADRGVVLFENVISDGATSRPMWFGYTPQLGVTTMLAGTDTFTTGLGTSGWTTISAASGSSGGDGYPRWLHGDGDFVVRMITPAPTIGAIVRGHIGSLVAEPSSIPATGGTQNLHLDLGPAHGNHLYVTLASAVGTSPGFASPLGPQTIPLNLDAWIQLSLDLANSVVWPNSLWFTDVTGKPIGAGPAFVLPPGFSALQGLTLHHAVVALNPVSLGSVFVTEPVGLLIY